MKREKKQQHDCRTILSFVDFMSQHHGFEFYYAATSSSTGGQKLELPVKITTSQLMAAMLEATSYGK